MDVRKTLTTTLIIHIFLISAWGWNIRLSPEEETVNWPVAETLQDRAGTFIQNPEATGPFLTAEVVADGVRVPMGAKFDDSGNLLWSYRAPDGNEDFESEINLASADSLYAYFTDSAGTMNVFANFNPESGLAPRYQLSIPALAPADPITNPLGGGMRLFQPMSNGKLAIVQIEGNLINILMIGTNGATEFAKTYTFPAGDAIVIPGFPPIGGLLYNFAIVSELENGDFYLLTSGINAQGGSSTAAILRLDQNGDIVWSRTADIPGLSAITTPLGNDKVLLASGLAGETVDSVVAVLSSDGSVDFSSMVQGAVLVGAIPGFYSSTDNILLSGSIITGESLEDPLTDAALLMLSDTGTKLAETAFDLNEVDFMFNVGTDGTDLFFDIFGSTTDGEVSHSILGRSDMNLSNWLTRSYFENIGPSASASSFLLPEGNPALTYQSEDSQYLYYQQLTSDLVADGDCELLVDTTIDFYDPEFQVTPHSLSLESDTIESANWAEAPTPTPYAFNLVEIPLVVEAVCESNSGGGGDVESLWNAEPPGDKKTGIGWINDSLYPYIWHYSTGGYMYIVDDFSEPNNIYGWDYVNAFWFWTSESYGGWYYNLSDPTWGPANDGFGNWGN